MHVLAPTVTALAMRAPAPAWIPGGESPSYLDGSLAGDVGFDPLCLTALARTDLSIDSSSWTEMSRQNVMVMATPYEVRRKVAWMREAQRLIRAHHVPMARHPHLTPRCRRPMERRRYLTR